MQDLDKQEARITALEDEVKNLKEEAKAREVKQLRWGIRVLGIIIMAMGGWIWSQLGHLFDLRGQ